MDEVRALVLKLHVNRKYRQKILNGLELSHLHPALWASLGSGD